MTETFAVASMSATLPHPPLNLRQVLLVHLLVFQEALFEAQTYKFTLRNIDRNSYTYPVVIYNPSVLPCPVDTERFESDDVYRAVITSNQCDHFCVIMERFVRRYIRELLSTTTSVSRIVFEARPSFRAIFMPITNADIHSCLLITEDGQEMIFDGTIDQYGLNWRTYWLLTKKKAMDIHMGDLEPRDDGKWDKIRETLSSLYNGYWTGVADRRIEELLETLDWDSLRGLSDTDIESSIRAIARRKFSGAFEEANNVG